MLKAIPKEYFDPSKGTLKLLWEEEWRGLGITQVGFVFPRVLMKELTGGCAELGMGTLRSARTRTAHSPIQVCSTDCASEIRSSTTLTSCAGDPSITSHRWHNEEDITPIQYPIVHVYVFQTRPILACIKRVCGPRRTQECLYLVQHRQHP